MRTRGATAAVLLAVMLAACTPSRAEPPALPSPTASPTPTATTDPTDPDVLRATGTPVASGAVALTVVPPGTDVRTDDDGSAHVTAPGEALVVAPVGMTLTALADGSAVVRDAGGVFVGGLVTEPRGAGLSQVGPEVLRLDTGSAGLWFTTAVVLGAVWGEAEGGRSLAVTPSAWARAGSQAAQEGLWAQVVALAPDADSPGMQAQLECHELGAPDKATWNLEPWRPEVGLVEMITARCNP
ncbi:DUF2599 domain-containing protein [Cellulomonas sp. Root137]|uniref:DUF2599 domain-containing protein n=1 Tax=Cellulomonas sp. Root137 TaxID=1736459 RepID=UPI000B1E7F7A|nr:DUF2599 domain-containing protein [Cellulomonas sp. Root137]